MGNIKKLTGSKFAQHVILVPVIGWLLVYQNTFVQIVSEVSGMNMKTSLSWEVLLFYIGLVLLGCSASIFRVFCPEPIVSYSGMQGYIEGSESILTRKEFERICIDHKFKIPDEVKIQGAGTGQSLDSTLDQWKRLNRENIHDVLSEHYRKENTNCAWLRGCITITFGVAAIFTLTPTVKTVIWVLGEMHAIR